MEPTEQLFSMAEIEAAIDTMAAAIHARLRDSDPLVLTVMTGGMIPAAMLLTRLAFPLQVDYIHLTRYGLATRGGDLTWIRPPPDDLSGRHVLLVDDLLDHGLTLQAAKERCQAHGAVDVLTAVLLIKSVARRKGLAQVDFHGLETSDRYVFGFGMDYKGYRRNMPGIFALAE